MVLGRVKGWRTGMVLASLRRLRLIWSWRCRVSM
jgi:hypothetical protein